MKVPFKAELGGRGSDPGVFRSDQLLRADC